MDNFKQLIREALTPEFLKESVNEAKAKIGSKIKVHRDEYDKKPLTMTLSRKIPGDYDDAYEATYETIPTGIPKRSEKNIKSCLWEFGLEEQSNMVFNEPNRPRKETNSIHRIN